MPRTYPPPRVQVRTRIAEPAVGVIDKIAGELSSDRSKVVRALIAEALTTPSCMVGVRRRLRSEEL